MACRAAQLLRRLLSVFGQTAAVHTHFMDGSFSCHCTRCWTRSVQAENKFLHLRLISPCVSSDSADFGEIQDAVYGSSSKCCDEVSSSSSTTPRAHKGWGFHLIDVSKWVIKHVSDGRSLNGQRTRTLLSASHAAHENTSSCRERMRTAFGDNCKVQFTKPLPDTVQKYYDQCYRNDLFSR